MFQIIYRGPACAGATYLLILLLCAACKKADETSTTRAPSPVQQKAVEQSGGVEPAVLACNLITSEEVSAIQKATITEAKSSAGPNGNLVMSQCYYSAKEPNMSVSVAVIQPDSRKTDSNARKYWDQIFGSLSERTDVDQADRDKGEKRGTEAREEEERKVPPKKIDGVGEQASWSGTRFGGALYVLQKDVILRISVGGPDGEETKIAKSKAIAEKALKNL